MKVQQPNLNRIKEILKEQGRTQTWLAKKIGKSYVVVSRYCNNNAQPRLSILTSIAEVLDVDIRKFIVPMMVKGKSEKEIRINNFEQISRDIINQLENVNPKLGDLSDIGNHVGIAIGKYIIQKNEDNLGFTKESFINGFNHGISLIDGTH